MPAWRPRRINLSPSTKQDGFLIPALFLLNLFFFAAWNKLIHLATAPWLILIWLFAVVMLIPLGWRDKAPVAIFAIEWVLSVAAWPIMPPGAAPPGPDDPQYVSSGRPSCGTWWPWPHYPP